MYQALYRKWRPTVFDDVVGEEHVTSILKSEVENGKISHAYLFCGPRGTGNYLRENHRQGGELRASRKRESLREVPVLSFHRRGPCDGYR